jgi:serine/threonine-protein kinase
MGVVYKATDPVIGRAVAVKTIRLSEQGTGLSRPELLQRFQTEARAAGLLTHPNIVVVFDAGEEDGLFYITMELVEGKSLQALLDSSQGFPLPRVLRIMEQTCSALQFAHERNVVHRDIKPANLMLTGDDIVKVTDFGTAKILQFGTQSQTAHVMGTPSYMSPEQVKGKAVDGRSDIFSLGVMLYEMVTGEKPFPGQNITTVIYKIVNEEPVPPRQIDPSIHPGISAVVMKALTKDPDLRYQSCREMLEDLKSYRAYQAPAGNPDATMISAGPGSPGATLPLGIGGGRNSPAEDYSTTATTLSLTARASSPSQTPAIRRTGVITPLPEPKKSNVLGTILAALFLVGVIIYGGNKLRPVFEDARQLRESQKKNEAVPNAATSSAETATTNSGPDPDSSNSSENSAATPKDTPTVAPVSEKKIEPAAVVAPPKKSTETGITAKAAEYKGRIEEALAERGLGKRARVQGTGSTLTLAGRLRTGEHGDLLKFLRNAPPDVRVIDHIEYDDAPAAVAPGAPDDGGHPVPTEGRGAIHVVTDVVGATAVLHGPAGRVLKTCQTPCSFNNLQPQQYSLDVQKDGYKPVTTALQVREADVQDQKINLESLTKGLYITSEPAGADVFINGAKQSGQTPVTLPLGPGQYNLVLRLQGYGAHSESVQVKDNVQTQLDVSLMQKSGSPRVAWAQVGSNPAGAEIFVDGVSTGQVTPARVQVPTGFHSITLKMNGYQPEKRPVQTSDGGTVNVNAILRSKP